MADGGSIPNLGDLTPEEKAAQFRDFFKQLASIDDDIAILKANQKTIRKRAKVEGIEAGDLNWALGARKVESTDIVIEKLQRRAQIAGWLNLIPKGTQLNLFPSKAQKEVERAYGKGAVAASFNRREDPAKDGYDPTSEEGQSWMRGYRDQNDEDRANLASGQEKLRALKMGEEDAAEEAAEENTAEPGKETGDDEGDEPPPNVTTLAGRKAGRGGNNRKTKMN